jgi:hypothetical protein
VSEYLPGTSETRSRHVKRPWVVGVVGLLIGVAIVIRVLAPAGWDASALASFGVEEESTLHYAQERLPTVAARPSIGHDGRFFFVQANDPFLLDPEANIDFVDRPVYRSQRMLYPLLAGFGGVFSPSWVIWGLAIVNLVALGVGTWAVSSYASAYGLTPWLGLAFALNPGLINELTIDGAGVLAFALLCASVAAMDRDRGAAAIGLLVLSALTREVMLVGAAGLAVWLYRRGERSDALAALGIPLGAVIGWAGYIRWRIPGAQSAQVEEIGPPLLGLIEAIPHWFDNPVHLIVGLGVLAVLGLFLRQLIRGRNDLLGYAAAGFILVALALTAQVWLAGFDITRAVAPVFTALIVAPHIPRFTRSDARNLPSDDQ